MTAKEKFKELGYDDVTDYGKTLDENFESEYAKFGSEQSVMFCELYKCPMFNTHKNAYTSFSVDSEEELDKLCDAVKTKMYELGWWTTEK